MSPLFNVNNSAAFLEQLRLNQVELSRGEKERKQGIDFGYQVADMGELRAHQLHFLLNFSKNGFFNIDDLRTKISHFSVELLSKVVSEEQGIL